MLGSNKRLTSRIGEMTKGPWGRQLVTVTLCAFEDEPVPCLASQLSGAWFPGTL